MIPALNNITILKRTWWLIKPFKFESAILLLVMLISAFFEMLNVAILYPVINYGLKQSSVNVVMNIFNKIISVIPTNNLFMASCVLLIIITICSVIVKYINGMLSNKMTAKVISNYQKKIFLKYTNSDYSFFVNHKQGDLIHTGTTATEMTSNMILTMIRLCNDLLYMILLSSLLFSLSWQGFLLIVLIGLVYYITVKKIAKNIIIKYGNLQVQADREKTTILNEFLSGVKSIKIFLASNFWEEKYERAVNNKVKSQYNLLMGRLIPELTSKFISFSLIGVIGIYLSLQSEMDMLKYIPLLGIFVLTMNRLIPVTNTIGNHVMVMTSCLPNVNIVYDLIRKKTKKIPEGSMIFHDFSKEISFNNIWFKYKGSPKYLLQDINFTIQRNKVVAIVGSSGNGKTTLLNLLLRLIAYDKGEIRIDGVNIREYTLSSYLSKIGYVSQETFMFNNTIKENIRFGGENYSDEKIIESAKLSHAHEFIMDTQYGYDTIVGDAGVKLSGGQKQRIAIARAILRKPEILFFDEATSALDNIAEQKVQKAINQVSKYTTVLLIAHRFSTIKNADNIIVLNNGKITEQGKHKELMSIKGEYYRLYSAQ
jgi:ATP-binding cassette subfamily B protein